MHQISRLLRMALLVVPLEIGIRLVERRYGRNFRFAPAMSNFDKLDLFLDDVEAGADYDILIAGSSACMYGIRPDILGAALGNKYAAYNLSFSGTSFLIGLEIVRHLRLTPKQIIVCVSPFNFTRLAYERDRAGLAHLDKRTSEMTARDHPSAFRTDNPMADRPSRQGMSRLLRICDPRYRAGVLNLTNATTGAAKVFDSLENFGRCITVSNDEKELFDGGRYYLSYVSNGFTGLVVEKKWSTEDFELAFEVIEVNYQKIVFPDYRTAGSELFAKAETLLKGLQAKGAGIVFVRLPQSAQLRELEDRETDFDEAIRRWAKRQCIEYIDAQDLSPGFASDPNNFRDPAHLHDGSARKVSSWIAAKISALLR